MKRDRFISKSILFRCA